MTLPKMRLKNSGNVGPYCHGFLTDLSIKGWLYIYSMDDYNNWKKGRAFKTERPTIVDWSDYWYHSKPDDWEELLEVFIPPELFEL